jgi:hypothetical protein
LNAKEELIFKMDVLVTRKMLMNVGFFWWGKGTIPASFNLNPASF